MTSGMGSCAAVQTSWQQCCATAFTPMQRRPSYRCVITRHHSTAALFMHAFGVLCCCAKEADSILVPLHLHLSRLAIQTGVSLPNTNAQQHCSGQNACFVFLCCCAKQADSGLVPLHLHLPRFAVHRVCNHQRPVQCSTLQGRMHALLLSAAVPTSWQQC